MFDFSFQFDDTTVQQTIDNNGGIFGTLSYDGPAAAGTFNWSTLSGLAVSFTMGSDVFSLSNLLDPLSFIEMTVEDQGAGVFAITNITDVVGGFAQFGGLGRPGDLAFTGAPGEFVALSTQFPGAQRGNWTAETAAIDEPPALALLALGLLGLRFQRRARSRQPEG